MTIYKYLLYIQKIKNKLKNKGADDKVKNSARKISMKYLTVGRNTIEALEGPT